MNKKKVAKPHKIYLTDKKQKGGIINALKGNHTSVYENFYKELTSIADDQPVDMIITTQDGPVLWCSKISYVLKNRSGKSRAFVKGYAHSAGTVIALSATELYLTFDSTFSAIDAQAFPLADLLHTSLQRLPKLIEDPRSALVDISTERAKHFRDSIEECINEKIHDKKTIMENMHDKVYIHEHLFFKEKFNDLGIKYSIWDGNEKKLPEPISVEG